MVCVRLAPARSTLSPLWLSPCFDNDPFCLSPNPFLLITIWTAYMRIPPSSSFTRAPRKLPIFNRLPTLSPKQPGCTPIILYPDRSIPRGQSGTESAANAPSFAVPSTLSCPESFLRGVPCAATHLPSFQSFPHSLQKQPGCTPESNPKTSSPLAAGHRSPATSSSRPLHPPSHGGTICPVIDLAGSSVIRETFPFVPVSKIQERTTGSTARLIQQLARDRRPGPLAIRGRHPALPFTKKGRPGKASSVRLGS